MSTDNYISQIKLYQVEITKFCICKGNIKVLQLMTKKNCITNKVKITVVKGNMKGILYSKLLKS